MHRQFRSEWASLPDRVGLESAQQLWEHLAHTPGRVPAVGTTSILRGRAGRPMAEGFSRTVHYEISGAGRVDYQFCDRFRAHPDGDEHAIVVILAINLSSH